MESNKCKFSSFLQDAIGRGYVLHKQIIEVTQSQKCCDSIILSECVPNGQTTSCNVIADKNFENGDDLLNNQGILPENIEPLETISLKGLKHQEIQSENMEIVKSGGFENATLLKRITQKTEDCKRVFFDFDTVEINNLWNNLSKADFKAATLFIVLQDSLQGLCENIILVDKLAYISEFRHIVQDFRFVKVTDDKISPRCLALVASKR